MHFILKFIYLKCLAFLLVCKELSMATESLQELKAFAIYILSSESSAFPRLSEED